MKIAIWAEYLREHEIQNVQTYNGNFSDYVGSRSDSH